METERLERIVREYGSFLRKTISRLCPRDLGIQCEDIEQDAYLRLWRALEAERNIKNLTSYIYRVAVTTTLDAVRRVKARREQQSLDAESRVDAPGTAVMSGGMVGAVSSPSQAAHGSQILEQVLRALDRLPANRRRAVGLHLQGMSSTEVGAILGWSEAKARNLIYRGLDDLRRHLRAAGITSPDDASLGD
jgi:RNA polymerase sigma-70 factor (ECF subfamily)